MLAWLRDGPLFLSQIGSRHLDSSGVEDREVENCMGPNVQLVGCLSSQCRVMLFRLPELELLNEEMELGKSG